MIALNVSELNDWTLLTIIKELVSQFIQTTVFSAGYTRNTETYHTCINSFEMK